MRLKLVLIVLLSLSTTGCMDLVVRMELKQDGSLHSTMNLEMQEQTYQRLIMMAPTFGADASVIEKENIENYLQPYQGRLKHYYNQNEQGVRKIQFETQAARGVALLQGFKEDMMTLRQKEGHYEWAFLESKIIKQMAGEDGSLLQQQLLLMRPFLNGLNWKIDMVVPEIMATNLAQIDQNTARLAFDFDEAAKDKSNAELAKVLYEFLKPKHIYLKGLK